MSKTAIIGGTGECGKSLLANIFKSPNIPYQNLHLIARRSQDIQKTISQSKPDSINITESIIDFEELCNNPASENFQNEKNPFKNVDKVFCTLGTTKKAAGSAERFTRIDRDYVVAAAKMAKENGVEEFHYVGSKGEANSMFLYMRTKGEIRDALKKLNFKKLVYYQPGVLLVNRVESRPTEAVIQNIFKGLSALSSSVAVSTDSVGKAMVYKSLNMDNGFEIVENNDITGLAKKFDQDQK